MNSDQHKRVISAIEYTLEQMRNGPRLRSEHENADAYEQRVEGWYRSKHCFVLFAIRCIKNADEHQARKYLGDLYRISEKI